MSLECISGRAVPARRYPKIPALSVLLVGLSTAPAARAQASVAMTWWVEARPWTCVGETGPLARQIELACDATGTCRVARDERMARRRAILECSEDGWTLAAQDAKGAPLWSLALGPGDDDDARLRRAAVWIARSEGNGAPAAVEVPPLPVAPAAGEAARPGDAIAPRARPRDAVAEPRPRTTPDSAAPHLFVGAMGHMNFFTATSSYYNDYSPMAGGRLFVVGSAPNALGPLRFGLATTVEHDLAGSRTDSSAGQHTFVRPGVLFGLGAPFDDRSYVGVSVEGGPAFFFGMNEWESGQFKNEVTGMYGQASLFLQLAIDSSARPFLAVSAAALTAFNDDSPNVLLGADFGVVWGRGIMSEL